MRDLVGGQRSAWKLNHRAEFVLNSTAGLGCNLLRHCLELATNFLQFIDMADQGDHDLGVDLLSLPGEF